MQILNFHILHQYEYNNLSINVLIYNTFPARGILKENIIVVEKGIRQKFHTAMQ